MRCPTCASLPGGRGQLDGRSEVGHSLRCSACPSPRLSPSQRPCLWFLHNFVPQNFLVFLSCLFLALLPRVSVGRKCDVGAKKNKKGAYFYTFAMHVTNECDTCCELARGSRQTRAGGVVCTRSTDPGIPVAFALCTCCALQWVCG